MTTRVAPAAAVLFAAPPALAAGGALNLVPDPVLLGILIALFVALIYPLNLLIFKPILRVFDERQEKITGTAARAEQLRGEADGIISRYERAIQEVREESELARRQQLEVARNASASELSGARAGAEREIDGARQAIASSLEDARTTLRGEAETLARQAAERVLGRAL
jgi:F-type H+-transporting ATPase subunit b